MPPLYQRMKTYHLSYFKNADQCPTIKPLSLMYSLQSISNPDKTEAQHHRNVNPRN